MLACKICGKKFKNKNGLGGHMSNAHPQNKPEDLPSTRDMPESNTSEVTEPESVVEVVSEEPSQPADEDSGIMESIRKLRKRGYDAKQIKEKFGYARKTVDDVFAEFIEPEEKGVDSDRESGLPITTKGTEVITPEGIMERLANGSGDWGLRLEGMMLLRAAQRMNRDDIEMARMQAEADAARIKPILELMKETRLEQDAAAARAKESSVEIADRAAYEGARMLAEQMMPEVRALKSQTVAGSAPDPVTRMMNALQAIPRMMQMSQQLMATMGMPALGTSSPQQLQPSQGMQSPGWPAQQPAGLGFQPATKDEIEEAFGDG